MPKEAISVCELDSSKRVHPIRPSDIVLTSTGAAPGSTLGKYELEASAGKLLSFFQEKGHWAAFSILELAEHYKRRGWNPNTMFYGLAGVWVDHEFYRTVPAGDFIEFGYDGMCTVTAEFIEACGRHVRKAT